MITFHSRGVGLALAISAAAAAAPALAHHSFAVFDSSKAVTLEGAVKEFQWTNPHVWIQLVVKDAHGAEVEWSVEASSASILARQGWTRGTMKPGDKVVVVVHPSKQGSADGQLVSAVVNGQPVRSAG